MKLNLGCGMNPMEGYVNVDVLGKWDVQHNLEAFPWPFNTSSADEILLYHVLEHLGAQADVFIGVMKELYRVCKPGGLVKIAVPHPRHDNFFGDPTHVRVVTPRMLGLFSKENCVRWVAQGAANSPLALYHDIDFRILAVELVPEEPWATQLEQKKIDMTRLRKDERTYNNVVREYHIVMEAVK